MFEYSLVQAARCGIRYIPIVCDTKRERPYSSIAVLLWISNKHVYMCMYGRAYIWEHELLFIDVVKL